MVVTKWNFLYFCINAYLKLTQNDLSSIADVMVEKVAKNLKKVRKNTK